MADAAPLSRKQVIARLRANTDKMNRNAAERDTLFDQRDELYLAARDAEPRITVREIAEIAGVTEVAVNKRMAQLRRVAAEV